MGFFNADSSRISRAGQSLKDKAFRTANALGLDMDSRPPINFVVDNAKWANYRTSEYLCRGVNILHPSIGTVTRHPGGLCGRILHFPSRANWLAWRNRTGPGNIYVVTTFHGSVDDGPEVAKSIGDFQETIPELSAVVVSTNKMKRRLLDMGVEEDKLHVIPLGVDTSVFTPPTETQRRSARHKLGIPEGAFCVGSFQKDGEGWGDGLEPKMIKGPDVFIGAVKSLNRDFPVFVMLTGPARGYVKARLDELGIPYGHHVLENYLEITTYYHALDLYIVASREEGGPLSLVEGMASGVPMVTTAVGMAPDIMTHEKNAMISPIGDALALGENAARVLSDHALRQKIIDNGIIDVKQYDWNKLASCYYEEIFEPLLEELER